MSNVQRDAHLFGPGSKRILSLDGGGIRGLITLGMLARVEAMLRERQPPDRQAGFVLSDYFDLISGTSTGSIIATWLALGNTVASARELYDELGPKVFSKPRIAGRVFWSKFDHTALEKILSDKLLDLTLNSHRLRTGLMITSKRVDTGSAWVLANNPKAVFWQYDNHRELRHLVRASTAAPTYFRPASLHIGNPEPGLFLDGAMAGYNNPSLATFLYATAAEYKLGWATGADKLFMLSLGTGYRRPAYKTKAFESASSARQALHVLQGLIHETSITGVALMQALSNPTQPFRINGEIKGLEETLIGGRALLHYERFDPPIDRAGLGSVLALQYTEREVDLLHRMDNASRANLRRLTEIGGAYGAKIGVAALPAAFDT